MADGGSRRRGGAGVNSEAPVTDDDLASAIAAETARVVQTGQVPIRGGGDAVRGADVEADRGAAAVGAGPGQGAADARQVDVRAAHRAPLPPSDLPSAGLPEARTAESRADRGERQHGRRAASRTPRARTTPTPIQLPEPTGSAAEPPGPDPQRGAPLPAEGIVDVGADRTDTGPFDVASPPTDITTLPPSVLPPQSTGPALVWAPADPFFDDAPRPTGRSSYIPPHEPGLTDLAAVPQAPESVPARRLEGIPDPAAGGSEPPPAPTAAPLDSATRSDGRGTRATGSVAPDATELPATVAMPVQPAAVRPIPDAVLRDFIERTGGTPPAERPPVERPPAQTPSAETAVIETVTPSVDPGLRRSRRARIGTHEQAGPRQQEEPHERAVRATSAAQSPLAEPVEAPAAPVERTVDLRRAVLPDGGPGVWSTLVVVAGLLATPLAIVLGIAVGGAGASVVAPIVLIVGVLPAIPAVLRLASAAGRTGLGTTGLARMLLGRTAGTGLGLLLLLARTLVLVEVLLAVGLVARAIHPVLVRGSTQATDLSPVISAVLAGAIAIVATVWRPRVARVVVVAYAIAAVATTTVLLVLLPSSDARPAPGGPGDVAAAAAGFCAIGLVLVLNIADAVRRRADGSAIGSLAGAVGGAAVGVFVLIAAIGVGRSLGVGPGAAADRFIGDLSTSVGAGVTAALAVPIIFATLALSVLLLRFAADSAAESIDRPRSSPVAAVVLGGVATAVAVALLAAGANAVSAVVVLVPLLGAPLAAWAGAVALVPLQEGPGPVLSRRARMLLVAGVVVGSLLGWLLADGLLGPGWRSPLLGGSASDGRAPLLAVPVVALIVSLVVGALGGCAAMFVDGRGPFVRGEVAEDD